MDRAKSVPSRVLRSAKDWSAIASPGVWMWVVTAIVVLYFGRILLGAYRATRKPADPRA